MKVNLLIQYAKSLGADLSRTIVYEADEKQSIHDSEESPHVRNHEFRDGIGMVVLEEGCNKIGNAPFSDGRLSLDGCVFRTLVLPSCVKDMRLGYSPDVLLNVGMLAFHEGMQLNSTIYAVGALVGLDTLVLLSDEAEVVLEITKRGLEQDVRLWSLEAWLRLPKKMLECLFGRHNRFCEDYYRRFFWGNEEQELTEVVVPATIAEIGEDAFRSALNLQTVRISEGVTSIGESAFLGCNNLTYVFLPDSLRTIGPFAFASCTALTSLFVPEGVRSIGTCAFYSCGQLTDIFLGEGLEELDLSAFYGCDGLTTLSLPASVRSITRDRCDSIRQLTGIHNLKRIVVAEGNAVYDSREDCNAIIETESGTLLLGCEETRIPKGVTKIGERAFWDCKELRSLTIPEGVEEIGPFAFLCCTQLSWVSFPDSLKAIKCYAFENSNVSSITIPANVREIGDNAFGFCRSLWSVRVFANVSLKELPFFSCPNLKEAKLGWLVTDWENAFEKSCKVTFSDPEPEEHCALWNDVMQLTNPIWYSEEEPLQWTSQELHRVRSAFIKLGELEGVEYPPLVDELLGVYFQYEIENVNSPEDEEYVSDELKELAAPVCSLLDLEPDDVLYVVYMFIHYFMTFGEYDIPLFEYPYQIGREERERFHNKGYLEKLDPQLWLERYVPEYKREEVKERWRSSERDFCELCFSPNVLFAILHGEKPEQHVMTPHEEDSLRELIDYLLMW